MAGKSRLLKKKRLVLEKNRKLRSLRNNDVCQGVNSDTRHDMPSVSTSLTLMSAVNPTLTDTESTYMEHVGNMDNSEAPNTQSEYRDVDSVRHQDAAEAEPYLVDTSSHEDLYLPTEGRRIVDLVFFVQQIQNISSHSSLFNCSLIDMSLIGENRNGLISKYKFKCIMCKKVFIVTNEDLSSTQNINVNLAAVTGITSSGIGYSQFQEITACMNIPIFSNVTYSKLQNTIYEKWEATAVESMEKSASREREAAVTEGKLSKDGVPVVDVYADGVWSSRSYGNNYKALSGAAAIVGRRFGEVLYIGIRNKYCLVCARAEKKATPIPEHICFKNYIGSSSGMEAEIICQGFESSVDMYGIIYGRLIADGDSVTYAKILARNPYPNYVVQKIECRNHLLRNMCNKLRAIVKEPKYPLAYRKTLSEVKIMTIRKVIIASIKRFKSEKEKPETITTFRNEVQNSIYHAYGYHGKCKNYYCLKEKTAQSSIEIENTTFWFRIKSIIQSLLTKISSLLEDVDTNKVECFNSVVAKIVGGKRINFSLRRGYRARSSAAVVFFNNPYPRYTLHKKILGRSPRSMLRKFEERRLKSRKANQDKPHKKNRTKRDNNIQHDYGSKSKRPDMTPDEFARAKELFLHNLKALTADKDKIQKCTIHQRDSSEWLEIRRNMITASNFGLVAKRRAGSSKANLVETILYKTNLDTVTAIAHGVENEQVALQQLAAQEKITIEPCGLFVDKDYPFIGATPDGLIGQKIIVEVKCPMVAFKYGLQNSLKMNKIQMWKYDKNNDDITLNRNSNWYYQVQGQLHVTGKDKCLFAVWSGENQYIKTEYIDRDDVFWDTKLRQKLVSFYIDWLLPEIVDSRKARGLPLREEEPKALCQSSKVDKRRFSFHSSSSDESNKPCNNKRQRLGELSNENKENIPCYSRQLTFDEM